MITKASLLTRGIIITRFRFSQQHQQTEHAHPSLEELMAEKIKQHGTHLGRILTHVESPAFRKQFKLKLYLQAHAWCCLHSWLLDFRSKSTLKSWSQLPLNLRLRWQLRYQLSAFNYHQIRNFSDSNDREVYYQLKRINNVIFFALDDYFRYGFKEKSLGQIVCEDLGLYVKGEGEEISEEEAQRVGMVEEYIGKQIQRLAVTPVSAILKGKFYWQE